MPETALQSFTHSIGSWEFSAGAESIRAVVFGHLAKLATPIVKHYMSDLYHDAMWLANNLDSDDTRFLFAVREMGTTIGNPRDYVEQFRDDTAKAWEVSFTRERHFLHVTFTPIY